MNNRDLEKHLLSIYEHLRSYDLEIRRLPLLNIHKIEHLIGICEDIGGNLSYLKLQGSAEEKIKYMATHISKDVGVVLRKAYLADGLFELRGFDFSSKETENAYRLITFFAGGKHKICVMGRDNNVDFWVDDEQLIKYLHLLEYSIKANPNLKKAFSLFRNSVFAAWFAAITVPILGSEEENERPHGPWPKNRFLWCWPKGLVDDYLVARHPLL